VFHFRPATNSNVPQKPKAQETWGQTKVKQNSPLNSQRQGITVHKKQWAENSSVFGSCHYRSIKIHKAF
jgi:hypothetical protein